MSPHINVIGGGIAGLAAAWELSAVDGVQVTVHEASHRWGGKVQTSTFAGLSVDEGADAFLLRVPWALDLVRELGLEDEVVHPAERRAYLWSRGALRPMPSRHVLGVPLDLDDLAATGLLDDAELAVTREAYAAPGPPVTADDVAVADLVAAATGRPVLDRVVAPLLNGINAGRADDMSAAALTPQLLTAGRHPGGLLAGLADQQAAADPAVPVFGGFEGGTGRLVDRLVEALGERGVELRLGDHVRSIGHLEADGLVLALPTFAAADLLADASPGAAGLLETITYASVVLVSLAVPRAAVAHPLDASGFLVADPEGLLITACSWSSTKWAHLGGTGTVVLRASAGSAGDERIAHLPDDDLISRLLEDLATTMGLQGPPNEVRVSHWDRSLPQYRVGHEARVADIEATLAAEHDGPVVLTGAAYGGVGLPACIHHGRTAARRLLDARG